jgi:hypothetical protein
MEAEMNAVRDPALTAVVDALAPVVAVTTEMVQAWGKPRFNRLFDEFFASDREPWEFYIWLQEQYCRSHGIGIDLTEQPQPVPTPTTCHALTQVEEPVAGFVSRMFKLARRVLL